MAADARDGRIYVLLELALDQRSALQAVDNDNVLDMLTTC
jgi:hypothetical protein